jgi:hypothetical protein
MAMIWTDLPFVKSEIFFISGLDMISVNRKLFARRVVLSHPCIEIALAREATQLEFCNPSYALRSIPNELFKHNPGPEGYPATGGNFRKSA